MAEIARRRFLKAGALASLSASAANAQSAAQTRSVGQAPSLFRLRPAGGYDSFDPWIEIDAAAIRHNVKEVARLAGGRPIMAVVKNNAYGLSDTLVGPVLAQCPEVSSIACVRVAEVVALREAGVSKPILHMAEVSDSEAAELVARNVWLSPWQDQSGRQLDRLAQRFQRAIPVHPYVDTGLGREGMPYYRALPWLGELARQRSVRIDGLYTMFVHDLDFDREQLARFLKFISEARDKGINLGTVHACPSLELFFLPEARLDTVRVGNALFGNYVDEKARPLADLRCVFRLRARVVRVEQLRPGDGSNYRRRFIATSPTWVATLPVGHTDGYPPDAGGTCHAMIKGRLYPVVGEVSAGHTMVEIGTDKTVEVGDVVTLIGPESPEIEPLTVATKTKTGFFRVMTRMNALLPRKVV